MSDRPSRWQAAGLIVAGALFFAVSLIVTAPARWVGELLARTTQGQWQLRDTSGSVWQGSGTLNVGATGAAPFATRLSWNVAPWWLLAGKLRADLSSPERADLHARIALGYHSMQLRDADVTVPATLLAALFPAFSLVSPTGTLRLNTSELTLDSRGMNGELQLRWLGAGGRLAGVGELGDYLLVANGEAGAVRLRGETLRGDVRLDLNGQWQLAGNGMLNLDGSVTASGPREAVLTPLLTMLNARREGERQVFQYSAPLPRPAWLGGRT